MGFLGRNAVVVVVILFELWQASQARESGSCMTHYIQLASKDAISPSTLRDRENALKSFIPPIDSNTVAFIEPITLTIVTAILGGQHQAQHFLACVGNVNETCQDQAPCQNGGKCLYTPVHDKYHCHCTSAFKGKFCESEGASPCASQPCEHGGTCVSNSTGFTCKCPQFYSGQQCERDWWMEEQHHMRQIIAALQTEMVAVKEEAKVVESRLEKKFESFLINLQAATASYVNDTLSGMKQQMANISKQLSDFNQQHRGRAIQVAPTNSPRVMNIRLVGGTASSGRVELLHNGIWGTVCDDEWDMADATVVCKMLGFRRANSAPHLARFGQGTGPIYFRNVKCAGDEESILSCRRHDFLWGPQTGCGHNEDASVVCL